MARDSRVIMYTIAQDGRAIQNYTSSAAYVVCMVPRICYATPTNSTPNNTLKTLAKIRQRKDCSSDYNQRPINRL